MHRKKIEKTKDKDRKCTTANRKTDNFPVKEKKKKVYAK